MIEIRYIVLFSLFYNAASHRVLEELVLPEPKRGAKALLPLIPLYRAEPAAVNWPHTRTTRGPFDAIMLSGALGASANNSAPSRLRATDDDEELAAAKGTWGEDELELSGEEKFSSAEDESKKDSDEELEGGGWGEDELELDEELDKVAKVAETAVPPNLLVYFHLLNAFRSLFRLLERLTQTTGRAALRWQQTTWRPGSLTRLCACSTSSSALSTLCR